MRCKISKLTYIENLLTYELKQLVSTRVNYSFYSRILKHIPVLHCRYAQNIFLNFGNEQNSKPQTEDQYVKTCQFPRVCVTVEVSDDITVKTLKLAKVIVFKQK